MPASPRPADVSARTRRRASEPQILPSFTESRPDPARIAQRAYERYESRGREDGWDLDDWLEAERELQQSTSGETTVGGRQDANSDEAA